MHTCIYTYVLWIPAVGGGNILGKCFGGSLSFTNPRISPLIV